MLWRLSGTRTTFAGLLLAPLKPLYLVNCKQWHAFAQCKSAKLGKALDAILILPRCCAYIAKILIWTGQMFGQFCFWCIRPLRLKVNFQLSRTPPPPSMGWNIRNVNGHTLVHTDLDFGSPHRCGFRQSTLIWISKIHTDLDFGSPHWSGFRKSTLIWIRKSTLICVCAFV